MRFSRLSGIFILSFIGLIVLQFAEVIIEVLLVAFCMGISMLYFFPLASPVKNMSFILIICRQDLRFHLVHH